jgi:galactokinase/mevalonate kinase-like predicted kinase
MNDLQHEGGLGSSGALTAALLSALHEHKDEPADTDRIVEESSRVEMDILEGSSGYHDYTITHLGGFRWIVYIDGRPRNRPMEVPEETVERFSRRLMLFYSGFHAKTKPSLALLAAKLEDALPRMDAIKQNAHDMLAALKRGDIDGAGECVQRQQDLKQKLPGSFENEFVVEAMRRARKL